MPGHESISGAIREACAKPGRSECAMVASRTAVRGRPSGPEPIGVAWVSTTLPVPSPSTMRITMVRASGQLNSATTGTPRRPIRKVTATKNRSTCSVGVVSTSSRVNEYG